MTCPFCKPEEERIAFRETGFVCLWDGFPVSEGHILVIPSRHISSWFEATIEEQASLLKGINVARQLIQERFKPEGFNIGINIGEAAGQTVPHLHVHVIPRYKGDVSDPRGGVRYVIPDKANYLKDKEGIEDVRKGYSKVAERPAVLGNEKYPLLTTLTADISDATQLDIAVAFVTDSGLNQIQPYLVDLFERGGLLRILTGDYLGVTEPRALLKMLDWTQEYEVNAKVRVFKTDHELGFHPKAYLIHRGETGKTAYIGSSNLTKHALTRGLEWNQRIEESSNRKQIDQIQFEFDRLFYHSKTSELSQDWIDEYIARRSVTSLSASAEGVSLESEIPEETPSPNEVQQAALKALEDSRNRGDRAGLVVMATGLGKTWLAAFDTVRFSRVLFVAHREEILKQAHKTFRKIRPNAKFGHYGGGEYSRDADVLFASIQTLGRQSHLNYFRPDHFDYIVIDEFHHAAATTYRRLIDHFDPNFLLGLTATPERSDGGDLLGLCGENLVYRCDLLTGINQELLCPFHYFGVPDNIDFENIPWRSGRFDPEKLEFEVATEQRANNAFEQWQKRGQQRTLAFCVSKRHADFMADFFVKRNVRSVAVHSGPTSAPRTQSLQQLERKEIEIVFAVDMFNEGVDIPAIDTVMMLRPTESRILWLQQLGRGLRKSQGKAHLNVIDYIGNHRTFLQVPMLLLPGAGKNIGEVSRALEALERGELELPLGCSVEYELEAMNILKQLARPTVVSDQISFWFRSFKELHGRRPQASEAWHEGYDPRRLRRTFGSWFGFVNSENSLTQEEQHVFNLNREFLETIETTQMSKSFKMVSLLAMIAAGKFPGRISISELSRQTIRIAKRIHLLHDEFGEALNDEDAMHGLLERNPIDAWIKGLGTKGVKYFSYENGEFRTVRLDDDSSGVGLRDLTQEVCDYRLSQYLDRIHGEASFAKNIVCKVSHSNSAPILFLPPRDKYPGIPEGWIPVMVGDERYQANFVKIAVNVLRKGDGEENSLPDVLRAFFGPQAGQPGTAQQVKFELMDGVYELKPLMEVAGNPKLWQEYMRAEIPPLWGLQFNSSRWNQGYLVDGDHIFLLVTLNKQGMAQEHQYADRFISKDSFQWVSQNRTNRSKPSGQKIANHKQDGRAVHLFVRDQGKTPQGKAAPFLYCGDLEFIDWEGDEPITVQWKLLHPLSDTLLKRFS